MGSSHVTTFQRSVVVHGCCCEMEILANSKWLETYSRHTVLLGAGFSSLSGGGISADCSLSPGGGISVEHSGDPSSMTIELEMNLILIVCTPLYMMGGRKKQYGEKENMSVINQRNLLNCQLYIIK